MFNLGSLRDKDVDITYQMDPDTMDSLFGSYSFDPNARVLNRWATDDRFDKQDNLGVQVNLIFSSHLATRHKIFYPDNPLKKTMAGEYDIPGATNEKMLYQKVPEGGLP